MSDCPNRCRKIIEKTQQPFMIKALNKVSIEGTSIDIRKAICDKPTDDVTLSSEGLRSTDDVTLNGERLQIHR